MVMARESEAECREAQNRENSMEIHPYLPSPTLSSERASMFLWMRVAGTSGSKGR